jgi:cysteinyl-tRNA synthetase
VGNVIYLKNLIEDGFGPMDYRYMCLTALYRMSLLFNKGTLVSAKNSYQRLKNICGELKDDCKTNEKYLTEFKEAIEDDLNMPNALAVLWNLLRDETATGKYATIKKMDEVFGLKLLEKEEIEVPKEVKELADKREEARKNKDWKSADELRKEIEKLGWVISDTKEGAEIKRKG